MGRILCGRDKDTPDIWRIAALPERLPPGDYALESGADPAQAALGWMLGAYRFDRYKTAEKKARPVLGLPDGIDRERLTATVEAVFLARDLINTPAEDMKPSDLAAAAETVAERHGAEFRVTVGDDLLERNFPAIHAVGRAAADAPRLIDLAWGDPDRPKVTLVGKGVCFDSGGLGIKPASGMKLMKKDMGGAATVLGLAGMIMALKLPVRLRLLIPAVENAIAGNAYRPMDVIRTRSGTTVEIGHTDAEGRVILCDALADAAGEEPDLLLDVATLTGAARVALGTELPALFCNDDAPGRRYPRAGRSGGRPAVAPAAVAGLPQADRGRGRRHHQRAGRPVRRRDHRRPVPGAVRRRRGPLGPYRHHGLEPDRAARPAQGRRSPGPARPVRRDRSALRLTRRQPVNSPARGRRCCSAARRASPGGIRPLLRWETTFSDLGCDAAVSGVIGLVMPAVLCGVASFRIFGMAPEGMVLRQGLLPEHVQLGEFQLARIDIAHCYSLAIRSCIDDMAAARGHRIGDAGVVPR